MKPDFLRYGSLPLSPAGMAGEVETPLRPIMIPRRITIPVARLSPEIVREMEQVRENRIPQLRLTDEQDEFEAYCRRKDEEEAAEERAREQHLSDMEDWRAWRRS